MPETVDQHVVMSDAEVDTVLSELSELVPALIGEYQTARADARHLIHAQESFDEDDDLQARSRPHPRRAVTEARRAIACATANTARRACLELAAWWAEVATYALASAALHRPLLRAQVAAADPSAYLDDHELQALPAPSESDRLLAELAARMGGDLLDTAREVADRAGLVLRQTADGEFHVTGDGYIAGRQRRLWGPLWTRHDLPALANSNEISELLTRCGVAPETIQDIRVARVAFEDVVAAELTIDPDTDEAGDHEQSLSEEEFDRLLDRVEQAVEVLADYASVVTRNLPAIRARNVT